MNKQAPCKTVFFLKENGNYMNRASKMEGLSFKKKCYVDRRWIIKKNVS